MESRSQPPYSRRVEIQNIYQTYASGQPTLPASNFLRFLQSDQLELSAELDTAIRLIDKYEIDEAVRGSRGMTFEGFFRYMESKDCCVFNQAHTSVYQDMNQPLSSYFISSSHNTYLTGGQLIGKSHLDAYFTALRKGCRCLEIDCWDGENMEPVVFHGHTLTTKILFKDVISTVEEHAFEVSPYPVILSLENHCSKPQQEVMAEHLTSILGDKLLRCPLNETAPGVLPSPNDLKYKILIKNKKLAPADEVRSRDEFDDEEDEEEEEEEEVDEYDEEGETQSRISWFWSPRKRGSKKKKVVVAQSLSDLVIYTRSVKFVNFAHSESRQNFNENTSMAEMKARKLAKVSGRDFVLHNQRFLSRIYPAGVRTTSSNYNPQEFWNVGSQLVALNFQSFGKPMDLNDGRFLDNGGCGYVLKPAVLTCSEKSFNPHCRQRDVKPTQLLIKVISGSNLPIIRSSRVLDSFVKVEIHGIGSDYCQKSTSTVKNNSLNPYWGTYMSFRLKIPELCLIRFNVRDQTGFFSSEFVGQYTLPFNCLKKGYRWVPLRSRDGYNLDPASLFVYITHS
ncbi:1-phosphatidylinositol 4,5-bisphosphate phosphodiesterase zeta-1-like [Neosynchiropus ocellatus]